MRNTVRRLVLVVMTMFLYVGLFLSHQQILVQAKENDAVTFTTPVNNAYVNGLATESLLFTTYHVLPKGSYYLTEDLSINMPNGVNLKRLALLFWPMLNRTRHSHSTVENTPQCS